MMEKIYQLIITKDSVEANNSTFDINNLSIGDSFKPINVYFQNKTGEKIRRQYNKNERRNSNQTLPRLAFQIYEKEIESLTKEEKLNFPTCQYTPDSGITKGIFDSIQEIKEYRNSIEFLEYKSNTNYFVIYCWNIFSTLMFVQECLKRFGNEGDQFILEYKEKTQSEILEESHANPGIQDYVQRLKFSPNLILRGAPGTGKTYLARQIAKELTGGNDDQIGFVQFHPSYDYTDFVEGLRPVSNGDGSIGFELRDGIFKKFCQKAKKNFIDSQKSAKVIKNENDARNKISTFFEDMEFPFQEFKTQRNKFFVTGIDEKNIHISIPDNEVANKLKISIQDIEQMLGSGRNFNQVNEITHFFEKQHATQGYSYYLALFKQINKEKTKNAHKVVTKERKNFVFIIDEINRGEISKIFGELFFSIDPSYRGEKGAVSTQYANLHETDEKFYIPENVYIIGTMNDIDRSVDTFDFAMRRRFRFVEVTAEERADEMLSDEEVKDRLRQLNAAIEKNEELGRHYQIGPSYFIDLDKGEVTAAELWSDYLKPLLEDYLRGSYDELEKLKELEKAYNSVEKEESDETDG
ncbi:McrB family protein [Streptococcus caviae]|uniref:McrB family protein n=1 Tax=Streptococcus sp. 'caviae' TaxID=1915004 RepID=UPI00094B890E|nr:endonuclease [Streptococcus sp. 'caviae']